ncbi:MAG: AsmA-like C-terminal region-containing protein, partial [Pseudomonadota bacterium]
FSQVADTRQEPLFVPEFPLQSTSGSGVDMDLWLDFASPSHFLMTGQVNFNSHKPSPFAQEYFLNIPFSANISGNYDIDSGLFMGFRDIRVDDQLALAPASLRLHHNKLAINLAQLDLALWSDWLGETILHAEPAKHILQTLNPRGMLFNATAVVDLQDIKSSYLQAKAHNISVDAWKNIPALAQVSGYMETRVNGGFLFLDTQGFSLDAQRLFSQPLEFSQAKAYIDWSLLPQQNRIQVRGFGIDANSIYGQSAGNFSLDVPWKPGTRKSQLYLQVGLQNARAVDHKNLLPKRLPEDFTQWIHRAVQGGTVKSAGLLYRGGLGKHAARSTQLFVDIADGRLAPGPEWPDVKGIDGSIVVNNASALGRINAANYYGREKLKGSFDWNTNNKDSLTINVAGSAATASGLRFVKDSLLADLVGDFINQVDASGSMAVDVALAIPINNDQVQAIQQASQRVSLNFTDSSLSLMQAGLRLDNINGKLSYSDQAGFSSNEITGTLFDQAFAMTLQSEVYDAGKAVAITGSGLAKTDPLAQWLDQPFMAFLSGDFAYDFDAVIPIEKSPQRHPTMTLRSDLVGVTSTFPGLFAKSKLQPIASEVIVNFTREHIDYDLQMGTFLSARYRNRHQGQQAMSIAVTDAAPLNLPPLPDSGFKLQGQFQQLDGEEWGQFLSAYPREQGVKQWPGDIFIAVNSLSIGEHELNNLLVSGQREQQGWSLVVDSDNLLGAVYLDDNKQRPLLLDIDYLNWPPGRGSALKAVDSADDGTELTAEALSQSVDPLAAIDPSQLPAIDLSINRLVYQGKPLGSWSLSLRADAQGLELTNIYASAAGLSLVGNSPENGAYLRWQKASDLAPMSTRFVGRIQGGNPKDLFDQWDIPPTIESEKMLIDTELAWSGSPLSFDIERLKGSVNMEYQNGVFVQEEASKSADVLRLFGLLNFDSIARRVRLDFSDVYRKGIAFDEVKGLLVFDNGIIQMAEPIEVIGPSSRMTLSGMIDYPQQTVDAKLVATLPIGGNLTVVTALLGGLPAAAGVYLVSKLFEKQVDQVSSINYKITGAWNQLDVQVERLREEGQADDEFLFESENG